MSKKVPLGGQRLGTGNKIEVNLHGYDRANFNLDKVFRSSMTVGTLVPFYCNLGLNGDTFDINLSEILKTVPTVGPLFGSFKLQLDMFTVPIRLYNGLLHNNAIGIGMDMKNVKMPTLRIRQGVAPENDINTNENQINTSSLLSYIGFRGIGLPDGYAQDIDTGVSYWEGNRDNILSSKMGERFINAIPVLGYYDIFKNYYANKQEKDFYVITPQYDMLQNIEELKVGYIAIDNSTETPEIEIKNEYLTTINVNDMYYDLENYKNTGRIYSKDIGARPQSQYSLTMALRIKPRNDNQFLNDFNAGNLFIMMYDTTQSNFGIYQLNPNQINDDNHVKLLKQDEETGEFIITFEAETDVYGNDHSAASVTEFNGIFSENNNVYRNTMQLKKYPLEILDQIREQLLNTKKGEQVVINDLIQDNYLSEFSEKSKFFDDIFGCFPFFNNNKSRYMMNGLCVKTYLSDVFNNWLDTEVIEGANGVSELSKVKVTDGGFTIDALNLAQKVYNMLNRISVSGGTYNDWQEVIWDVESIGLAETPIYEGGMSAEITFSEVVSTADTSTAAAGEQPLGTIAGKGFTKNVKGGNLVIKIKEPSFIMGIASITPRIDYSQGNKFYLTEVMTMDDLHKPALDGIGFQDLMMEKMSGISTRLTTGAGTKDEFMVETFPISNEQIAIGKQPAWIDYQTDYNECFGDFAEKNKAMFLTLNRRYELDKEGIIEDATTYIDPSKYNYAFADTALEAQNFWLQVGINVNARRKMSAKIIPNI